ncbi:MAG: cyclic nucleotide-binding domain-containing protein [Burkholderiaceae bacterium]
MIKSDGPGSSFSPLNPNDRVIAKRNPGGNGFGESAFAPSTFGNSTFGHSDFANSTHGNSTGFGPSGIVPSATPGMPQSVMGLIQAMHTNNSIDTIKLTLGVAQWQILSGYLQGFTMEDNQVLIEQGSKDTTVYLVESGTLGVIHLNERGEVQQTAVGAGSCVGEGSFFSRIPRVATVQASSRCKLWSINPMRFTELSNRHAAVALPLVMAMGSVMARRLSNRAKRGAVT